MSDAFEVTLRSNDPTIEATLKVCADDVQQLHDRLVSVVDAASFSLIGAAVSAMRDEVNAQKALGDNLDARPNDPPVANTAPEPAPPAQPAPTEKPADNPWDAGQTAPNLPTASNAPAPPAPAGGLPPMPKWAQ